VRDVSGKKTASFTWGNNFWLGSEMGCKHLVDAPKINLMPSKMRNMLENATDIRSEIPLTYRMFYIAHRSSIQFDIAIFNRSLIHMGICMPKACIESDAREIGEKILVAITCEDSAIFGDRVSFESTKTLELRSGFGDDIFVVLFR
jgi:hypothetical protein